jgi:adenylylsulfate kinase-like enzyme
MDFTKMLDRDLLRGTFCDGCGLLHRQGRKVRHRCVARVCALLLILVVVATVDALSLQGRLRARSVL